MHKVAIKLHRHGSFCRALSLFSSSTTYARTQTESTRSRHETVHRRGQGQLCVRIRCARTAALQRERSDAAGVLCTVQRLSTQNFELCPRLHVREDCLRTLACNSLATLGSPLFQQPKKVIARASPACIAHGLHLLRPGFHAL